MSSPKDKAISEVITCLLGNCGLPITAAAICRGVSPHQTSGKAFCPNLRSSSWQITNRLAD